MRRRRRGEEDDAAAAVVLLLRSHAVHRLVLEDGRARVGGVAADGAKVTDAPAFPVPRPAVVSQATVPALNDDGRNAHGGATKR